MMLPRVKHRQVSRKRPGLARSKTKPKLTFTQVPERQFAPSSLSVQPSEAPIEQDLPNIALDEDRAPSPIVEEFVDSVDNYNTFSPEVSNSQEPILEVPTEKLDFVHQEILPEDRLDLFQPLSAFFGGSNDSDDSTEDEVLADAPLVNKHFVTDYVPDEIGFAHVGTPEELSLKLDKVGYQCLPYLAVQISLLLNIPTDKIRSLLLEGPSGCGKSYMAKSLAKVTGAELMCLSCYKEMPVQNLIESPSTFAMASAMAGQSQNISPEKLMNLGILSRAFLKSQTSPVILLIDELDKPDSAIDTFFLGPIQDSRVWLESRPPIDANPENLLIMFTKNFNRKIDEALLRRCHPILMTYLDSTLERKILSPHCHPQLVANLVSVADRMRNSGGAYAFERPPAPEELLTAGHYVTRLLEWGFKDPAYVGRNVWNIIAKSEHDRAVLEHMMRFHPDFMDPLVIDSKNAPLEEIHKRMGRVILNQIIEDPDAARREKAWLTLNDQ